MMAKQTEVAMRGKDNLSAVTKISNLSEAGPTAAVSAPEDDVDGRQAARALQSLQKLVFLKIILVDIGISLGDVVTDLVQGLSLIFEADWGLAPSAHYGALVLLTCWLPGPLTLLHLSLHHRSLGWLPYQGLTGVLLALLALLLFPLLPTLLYVGVLLRKRRLPDSREEQGPSELEKRAREVKAIAGVTESPLQVVVLGLLMLKGTVVFPWSQEVSSSCIEDDLGRRLCLPSIPMVSIFFSLASILKVITLTSVLLSHFLSRPCLT
jgi:hypothetical protein